MATTTKDAQLKKRLIIDAIIMVVVLVVLLAGALLIANFDDEAQSDKDSASRENNTLKSEAEAVQARFDNGLEINTYYDTYSQNHNIDFTLKREEMMSALTILREKFHLADLAVTISPITDVTSDKFFTLKTGKLTRSDIKLVFGALSDSSVYNFIEALQRQLPGVMLIYDVSIARSTTGDLRESPESDELIKALNDHKLVSLVSAQVSFYWVGIERVTDEKSDAAGATATGGARGK